MLKFATASMRFGIAAGAGLCSLLMVIAVSSASADQTSTSQLLIREKDVQKATVILMPDRVELLLPIKEEGLRETGCTYNTTDRSEIKQLIRILKDADLVQTVPAENQVINLRQGVYVEFSDGAKARYLFSVAAPGENVRGYAGNGENESPTYFTSKPVVQNLRAWTYAVGKNSNHGPLDVLREGCDVKPIEPTKNCPPCVRQCNCVTTLSFRQNDFNPK